MPEEFELLGQDFRTRGKRTDEGLALMKAPVAAGMDRVRGQLLLRAEMMMNPSPTQPIPIYVGGLSEIAFRRAARHDGWVGDIYTLEEAAGHARRLPEIRAELGATGDFAIITALSDAFLPEHFATAEAGRASPRSGRCPGPTTTGSTATLEQKLDGMGGSPPT